MCPLLHYNSGWRCAVLLPQVEVKLRLPGPEAHQQLAQLLAPVHVATHQQVGRRVVALSSWH
jgi:hypothetical protein